MAYEPEKDKLIETLARIENGKMTLLVEKRQYGEGEVKVRLSRFLVRTDKEDKHVGSFSLSLGEWEALTHLTQGK